MCTSALVTKLFMTVELYLEGAYVIEEPCNVSFFRSCGKCASGELPGFKASPNDIVGLRCSFCPCPLSPSCTHCQGDSQCWPGAHIGPQVCPQL